MSKLTDLELCKKIAEIEGVEIYEEDNQFYGLCIFKVQHTVGLGPEVFNPVTNWNLTGPLMVKYGIIYCPCSDGGVARYGDKDLDYCADESPQRAILMAIVAKDEALK